MNRSIISARAAHAALPLDAIAPGRSPHCQAKRLLLMRTKTIRRRDFIGNAAKGAAAFSIATAASHVVAADSRASARAKLPVLMKAGHQHDHSETTLRALAAFGVTNICSGKIGQDLDDSWSVEGLTRLRKHV